MQIEGDRKRRDDERKLTRFDVSIELLFPFASFL